MIFYFTLFLSFLYFKIARVHNKEEKSNILVLLQHIIVAPTIIALLIYGFMHLEWYFVLLSMFIFLIMASLIITTIQLGIFIDGKPLLGITKVYSFLPLFSVSIIALSSILWTV
jgi:hypothetical protein